MRKTVATLVAVNAVLLAALAFALTRPKVAPAQPAAATPAAEPKSTTQKTERTTPSAPAPPRFTWDSLASRDLRVYARNLREVGCPEETIKDIMLAEANRMYGLQERALKVRPEHIAPWETAALYDRRSGETKLRQLLEEKRNLLKELTGLDVGIDMPSRLAGRDLQKFEGAFGSLAQDKQAQVRAIMENYWAQSDDIKQRTLGYLEPEDRAEFLRIKSERRDALAKLLTPEEMRDFEIKTSDVTPWLKSRFEGFEVTGDEFNKVFEVARSLDDQYSISRRNPDPVDPEFTNARTQAEKDFQQQIKSVLGDERFAEYERSRDPIYRSISKLGSETGAPKENILLAYEAQQQLQQESRRILQDPTLTQEQRMQSLQDMRAQAQQTMQQFFGEKGAQLIQRLPEFRSRERAEVILQNLQNMPVLQTHDGGPVRAIQP